MFILYIIIDAAAQKVEIWWNLEKIVMNKKNSFYDDVPDVEETKVGDYKAIVPSISGRGPGWGVFSSSCSTRMTRSRPVFI